MPRGKFVAVSHVNIHQAKTNLSRLISEVEAGGDVVISRGNLPVARLVAINPTIPANRVPNQLAHLGTVPDSLWEPLSEDELAAWEGQPATSASGALG
jgi:prevent-host-death family protein